ncbi:MAG: HAMP domain-containing histidine kinase [Clostridiales bacterium]|nr:HAMP domain-containing histidine kinase [Clostridiales bacterium]
MDLWRNPEWKRQSAGLLGIGILLSGAGLLVSAETAFFVLGATLILNMAYFLLTRQRYGSIRQMALEIDRILHGEEELKISSYREGDLSILRDEIYKMTVRLREQAEHLKGEKIYLADALADISHQIRTPLTSLNLTVSRLQQPGMDERECRELLREMKRLLGQVEWLVESLLKMSKLDADSVPFSREWIGLEELLGQALQTLEIPMELKNQSVAVDIPKECGFTGDYAWSTEAVMNVLKNCMEYTPENGNIYITGKANPLYTELAIRDSGPGISETDLDHLFERFYRGRQAGKNSFGIGLALTRSILNKENATIKAENVPEGGSRFILRFYHGTI